VKFCGHSRITDQAGTLKDHAMVKPYWASEKWLVLYYQKGVTWINGKSLSEKKDTEEHPSEEVENSRTV